MSSSNSPCAACKSLRRKCTQECAFAPNFPPDQPQRFANVHKVFGAKNVAKLLNELSPAQREDAVNSLAYEAEARLRDPVYGCIGLVSILQQRLKQVQSELLAAKKELAGYIGPSALMPGQPVFPAPGYNMGPAMVANPNNVGGMGGYNSNTAPIMGMNTVVVPPHVEHQSAELITEEQQLAAMAAAKDNQEVMRGSWEQQEQLMRYNNFAASGVGFCGPYEMGGGTMVVSADDSRNQNAVYSQLQIQQQHQHNEETLGQLLILQQPEQEQQGEIAQAIPLQLHDDHDLHQQQLHNDHDLHQQQQLHNDHDLHQQQQLYAQNLIRHRLEQEQAYQQQYHEQQQQQLHLHRHQTSASEEERDTTPSIGPAS